MLLYPSGYFQNEVQPFQGFSEAAEDNFAPVLSVYNLLQFLNYLFCGRLLFQLQVKFLDALLVSSETKVAAVGAPVGYVQV